jgi:hypothetical protein
VEVDVTVADRTTTGVRVGFVGLEIVLVTGITGGEAGATGVKIPQPRMAIVRKRTMAIFPNRPEFHNFTIDFISSPSAGLYTSASLEN